MPQCKGIGVIALLQKSRDPVLTEHFLDAVKRAVARGASLGRGAAARFVREDHQKWWLGLEPVEHPNLFPPPSPTPFWPTPAGVRAGMPPEIFYDTEIYLSIARTQDGGFQVE